MQQLLHRQRGHSAKQPWWSGPAGRAPPAAALLFLLLGGTLLLQGCDDDGGGVKCDDGKTSERDLQAGWGGVSELLVDAPLAVSLVSALSPGAAGPGVSYSGCASADVANGDIGPDGHGTQQYLRLSLKAIGSGGGGGAATVAVVHNVSMNQLVARGAGTIVAEAPLFGYGSDMGLPLNITAAGKGASVTLRPSASCDCAEVEVAAEDGGVVDLGSGFGSIGLQATLSASGQGSSVTGVVRGFLNSISCSKGGRIEVTLIFQNGTQEKKSCGGGKEESSPPPPPPPPPPPRQQVVV